MPFLAPAIPALIGGAASAGGAALVNSAVSGGGGQKGSGYQALSANLQDPVLHDQDVQKQIAQSQGALDQQQQLVNALQAQNGIGNQSDVYAQQQALAGQLGAMAQGQGPNPALAQLNNTTGANVANQAALMAGQRGAGSNVGLIARQAGQQGSQIQQQAVGQAASMRAQQQLAAISALQQQQGMLGNIAGNQVAQQAAGTQFLNQAQQAQQGALLGQINNQNQQAIENASQMNAANSGIARVNAENQAKAAGGLASGIGAAAGAIGGAIGNQISKPSVPAQGQTTYVQSPTPFAEGGPVAADSSNMSAILKENYKGPKSKVGMHLHSKHNMKMMSVGGDVPGKAKVDHDSYSNDTVKALLSPGEFVIPKNVMNDPQAQGAIKLVKALTERNKRK